MAVVLACGVEVGWGAGARRPHGPAQQVGVGKTASPLTSSPWKPKHVEPGNTFGFRTSRFHSLPIPRSESENRAKERVPSVFLLLPADHKIESIVFRLQVVCFKCYCLPPRCVLFC